MKFSFNFFRCCSKRPKKIEQPGAEHIVIPVNPVCATPLSPPLMAKSDSSLTVVPPKRRWEEDDLISEPFTYIPKVIQVDNLPSYAEYEGTGLTI